MRRLALALLAGLTAGAWIGYRWGWLDGADYVEAWKTTEEESLADLCALLGRHPDEFADALAESFERLDARKVVH